MKRPYLLFCLGVLCLSWVFPPWVGRSKGTDLGFGFLLDPPGTTAKIALAKLLLLDMSIGACLAIAYPILSRPFARWVALITLGFGGAGVVAWRIDVAAKERAERERQLQRAERVLKAIADEEGAERALKAKALKAKADEQHAAARP